MMSKSFWLGMMTAGLWVETALAQPPLQKRCGWFSNPTPGNLWLRDADGEWLIGAQGGFQTPGDWPWPEFGPQQWVTTNSGDYGYGCACFTLRADPKSRRVLEIKTSQPRPLAACRQDPRLSPEIPNSKTGRDSEVVKKTQLLALSNEKMPCYEM